MPGLIIAVAHQQWHLNHRCNAIKHQSQMPRVNGSIPTGERATCISAVQELSSSPHGAVQRQESCSWPGSAQGLHQQDLYVAFGRLSFVQAYSHPCSYLEV